jgi:hypothetical protein
MADLRNETPASDCSSWASNSANQGLQSTPEDDFLDIFLNQDDPFQFGDPFHPYANCPCDCAEDEASDKECWAACDRCLGNAIVN